MDIRELEVLLALCEAALSLKDLNHAEKVVCQLASYLPEAHIQLFASSPFLHEIQPSPWAALTYQLANALLTLGTNHPSLRSAVVPAYYGLAVGGLYVRVERVCGEHVSECRHGRRIQRPTLGERSYLG